jgi:hypothetical protein
VERLRQKQVKIDELTHREWGDTLDYFQETVKKYTATELNVLAVVNLQVDDVAAPPAPTVSGVVWEYRQMVCGKS